MSRGDVGITSQRATELVEGIRTSFERAWEHYTNGCALLVEAYQVEAWRPLGLADWSAFVTYTLDVEHLKIPRAERQAIVTTLAEGGLSVRHIAAATGLGVGTVHRALNPSRVPNGTPGPAHKLTALDYVTALAATEEIVRNCMNLHWRIAALVWSYSKHVAPIPDLVDLWPTATDVDVEVAEMAIRFGEVVGPDQIAADMEEYRRAWRWAMSEVNAPDVSPHDEFEVPDLDWSERPGQRMIGLFRLLDKAAV